MKEIETGLLIDSHKDVPLEVTDEMRIAALEQYEEVLDQIEGADVQATLDGTLDALYGNNPWAVITGINELYENAFGDNGKQARSDSDMGSSEDQQNGSRRNRKAKVRKTSPGFGSNGRFEQTDEKPKLDPETGLTEGDARKYRLQQEQMKDNLGRMKRRKTKPVRG